MDFIDFDSFQQDEIPQPQPALSLPITSNIENLGKRFSNFNSLTKNLLKFDEKDDIKVDGDESEETKLAEKYANLSLNLINSLEDDNEEENESGLNRSKTTTTLSTRLSRVLNNSMPDSLVREIFANLDLKIENIAALVEPGITGSNSRKELRGEIENDLIKTQGLMLKEYQPVIKNLSNLENDLKNLNGLRDSITEKVNKDFQSTKDLNGEVKNLNDTKSLINLKKGLLISFQNKFALDVYEEYVLQNGEINDEFFEVLIKCEKIHENCSILLSVDNPQLGLKIMSKFNQLINKSVERIINFTNKTLNNLYSLNTSTKLTTLHQCLKFLRKRLNYFNTVIDNFVDTRSRLIIDEFLNQINGDLDKSGDNRSASIQQERPIILSAHDPVRFIGDLLAYIHSVVVNETETISSIFGISKQEHEDEDIEYNDIIDDVTGRILNSLSRSVKSKIEQVISSETKLATIYAIYNLVDLYTIMFAKHLKESSNDKHNLLTTVRELVSSSQNKIISIIQNKLTTIKSSNLAQLELNTDLQPPEWIIEFYSDILPIVDQNTSDTFMNLSTENNAEFMKMIINQPIEIFNEHIENNISKLFNRRDQVILKLNFLDLILSKIMPIILLSDKILELNDLTEKLSLELTNLQLDSLINGCQLTNFYNIINMICPFSDDFFDVSIYQPITENKLFTEDNIITANDIIQNFLPSALLDIQQSLFKVNSPMIVNNIITNSSLEFIKFYLKFNLIINEYLDDVLLIWSDIEVATLLGVEEPYQQTKKSISFE